tara:strand:+ start:1364 stop:2527 length:1164 start_codon:yes stop_codon:yes gene_type:complete
MKKSIAILGSTGSIGSTLLDILKKDKNKINILLLTANKDYINLLKQAQKHNVKNLIITNKRSYEILKNKTKKLKINVYNNFDFLEKIFKKKIDYVMSSISGLDGLVPTLRIIKFTKKIAIANKESIICAWNLIKKEINKNKTIFIPVDSEHFSIWYAIKNISINKIEKIYLTASGGPLLNLSEKKFRNVSVHQALKHPNWKMGKKISIDSSTLMNKVFEVIEAKHIFNIPYKKITILIHPSSYVHALIKFNNGLIKIIAHDTTMRVPIFNTYYVNNEKLLTSNHLNIEKLNNLQLSEVNQKKFPLTKILNKLPNKNSLYETVIVAANDALVHFFLEKKIKYDEISEILTKLIVHKEFSKYKKIQPKKIEDIISVKNHVSSLIDKLCI